MAEKKTSGCIGVVLIAVVLIGLIFVVGRCGDTSNRPMETYEKDPEGVRICNAVRIAGFATSCDFDALQKMIFVTAKSAEKNDVEAVYGAALCRGMLFELSDKGGITGWKITVRALSGQVLATCP